MWKYYILTTPDSKPTYFETELKDGDVIPPTHIAFHKESLETEAFYYTRIGIDEETKEAWWMKGNLRFEHEEA
jgi:hypothetical protein